jgi:hypothetical protein
MIDVYFGIAVSGGAPASRLVIRRVRVAQIGELAE